MHLHDKRSLKRENNEHHPFQSLSVPTPKPRTTIYLDPELYQALERRAKEERRSISNLCNILIEDAMQIWLETNPPPEPKDSPAAKPTTASKTKRSKISKT